MSRLLIVDDQESITFSMGVLLKQAGYRVDICADPVRAVQLAQQCNYDVVIADLRMEKMTGLDLLRRVRLNCPGTEVIIMTAFASIETAVEATREGAFDYVCKPFNTEDLLLRVRKAINHKKLILELNWLREDFRNRAGSDQIIGSSPKLTGILERAKVIGRSDCTVLITGETGTGKGLLASRIHAASSRSHKPFVAVNCANLSDQLLESELFGVTKGAYTGADLSRPGLCEAANQGTLFLDEIGAASPVIQSKLLTLMEEKTIRRLGDTRTIPINIRIISATNANLQELIQRREFREDLFYRLNVATFHLPPLRERPEDVPSLAEYFLKVYASKFNKLVVGFTPEAIHQLASTPFPGNIRQLENVIQQAVAITESTLIEARNLELGSSCPPAGSHSSNENECEGILKSIAENKFNVRRTASMLGISRTTLYRRLQKYGIRAR